MPEPPAPESTPDPLDAAVIELADQVFELMQRSGRTFLELGRSGYAIEPFEERLELIGPHGEGLGDLKRGVSFSGLEPGKVLARAARVFLEAGPVLLADLGTGGEATT